MCTPLPKAPGIIYLTTDNPGAKLGRSLRCPEEPPSFVPYGLYSLGDIMIKMHALKFIALGEEMLEARIGLDAKANVTWEHEDYIPFSVLKEMRNVCSTVRARALRKVFDEKLERYEHDEIRTCEELEALIATFKSELENRVFLYMPDAEYYQNSALLKPKARVAFPKLTQELRSAGNAYACGLPTACVFHCMRGLENALAALAADVGLKWEKEQWHNIIEMIEARIRQEGKTLPMGPAKDERLQFLSQAATQFMHFKEGWRNYVAHNRVAYEPEQALQILDHVRDFTDILSERLKE